MRRLTVAALLALAPPVAAQELPATFCPQVADMARTVMEARQNGVPMEKSVEIAQGGDAARDLALLMVEQAYDRPRWYSDSTQKREIQDFGEAFYKACYNSQK